VDDVTRGLQSLIACNQLNEFVAVLYSAWDKCHIPVEAMRALNFKDITPFFWHKTDHTAVGLPDNFVSSCEMAVMGRYRNKGQTMTRITLPVEPRKRHNFIEMKTVPTFKRYASGEVVNPCEKPTGLSEFFAKSFCFENDWCMIAGGGAGGDARGCIKAGMNVAIFEKDRPQYEFLVNDLKTYDAQLEAAANEVAVAEKRAQAREVKSSQAERNEAALIAKGCTTCGFTGATQATECFNCKARACDKCLVLEGGNLLCLPCKELPGPAAAPVPSEDDASK
jgi:hypothetical protein